LAGVHQITGLEEGRAEIGKVNEGWKVVKAKAVKKGGGVGRGRSEAEDR
jgi:hypothetical protein